ncbi:hypothetical protein ACFLVS_04665 [Chloroflexota bacterium]
MTKYLQGGSINGYFFYLFSDCIWLPLLEFLIAAIFIRAVVYDIGAKMREGGTGAQVTRGEKSWSRLLSFWGMSIILIEIVISSDLIPSHRIIIGLLNLGVLVYLNLWSVFFKNKIIGWASKLQNMKQQA